MVEVQFRYLSIHGFNTLGVLHVELYGLRIVGRLMQCFVVFVTCPSTYLYYVL